MEKQIPSILDSELVLAFERGVHFSLINTAVRPQNEETLWKFSQALIKNSQMQSSRFWLPRSSHRDHHLSTAWNAEPGCHWQGAHLSAAVLVEQSWRRHCQAVTSKTKGTPLPILFLHVLFVHRYTQEEFTHRLIVLMKLSAVLYALPTLSVRVMTTNLQMIFCCFNFILKHWTVSSVITENH